jgi:protoporphyrinogen/coproporphyrinogen III oxidase
MKQTHVVVIGGGIAGTTAAHTLLKKGYRVTIVEKNNRLGGRIHSVTVNNFTFELGAGFVTDVYTNIFNFLKEAGLDKSLQPRKSKSAIVKNNIVHRVSLSKLFDNDFLSINTKLRLIPVLFKTLSAWNTLNTSNMWQAYSYDTKSVSEVFQKKSDQELLDYLIQPILDGYFYWSAKKTSQAMLLLLLKAGIKRGKTSVLKTGLQYIPETAAKGCEVLLSHEVKEVRKLFENEYEVITNSKKIKADGIVCATTATVVPKIFKNLNDTQHNFFSSIHYSSTAIVAKTYKNKVVPTHYAIAYPRKEGNNLGTITIVSDKSTKTTLVKLFATGATGKKLCAETDKKIEATLLKDTMVSREFFDFSAQSNSTHIQRWDEALPEFTVGHFKLLKSFKEGRIETNERIVFAGDYIGGPFMEGAFTSGIQAAERLDKLLS